MKTLEKEIREIMETITLGLPEIDEHTLLDDIWFGRFSKELLARDLEEKYQIIISDPEIDHWITFGDIVATVEHYQH